jgi:hypothetical protein
LLAWVQIEAVLALEFTGELLAPLAALVGAIGGMLAGWAAIVRARNEKDDECMQRLNATRKELGEIFDRWELEREKRVEAESKFPADLAAWKEGEKA